SLLDQASSYSDKKIETAHISSILGTVGQDVIFEITEKIINKDTKKVLELFDNLIKRGKDLSIFISEFIEHLRNLMVAKEVDTYKDFIDAPEENLKKIKEQEAGFQKEELLYAFSLFSKALYELPHYPAGRIPVEVILIKLTAKGGMVKAGELLAKVEDLEKKLKEPSAAYGIKEESDFSKYGLPEKTVQVKATIKKEAEDNSSPAVDIERTRTVKSDKDEGVGFDWDDFQPVWEKACNAVKEKRTSLGLYISEGEPVNLKDGVLTVGFHPGFSFHRESLEIKKNKELIEQTFSDTLDKKIKIVFVDINSKKKKPALKVREKSVSKEKVRPGAVIQPQEEDSIISSAKSLFNGLLIKNDEPYSSS
ncbi:MAG: hypothetical protein KAU12_04325, partial [Candidatus Omnitrophica bacterium]|nr:hypothetical protein [Candidatus Omnitrophota bacterium]